MSKRSKQKRKVRKDQGEQTFKFNRFAEQQARKREYIARTGDLSLLGKNLVAHYHLMFNTVPNLGEGFETPTMAYRAMVAIRDHFKDDEYQLYEEGIILLTNVSLAGRTGKHQVFMQVGKCFQNCGNIRRIAVLNAEIENLIDSGQISAPRVSTQRPRGARYNPNPGVR